MSQTGIDSNDNKKEESVIKVSLLRLSSHILCPRGIAAAACAQACVHLIINSLWVIEINTECAKHPLRVTQTPVPCWGKGKSSPKSENSVSIFSPPRRDKKNSWVGFRCLQNISGVSQQNSVLQNNWSRWGTNFYVKKQLKKKHKTAP